MYLFISILIIVASILLILIVLVQNAKGGGLTSNFSSSNQVMGVRKTADFLEKATWILAIAVVVLCLGSSASLHNNDQESQSMIKEQVDRSYDQPPVLPTDEQLKTE